MKAEGVTPRLGSTSPRSATPSYTESVSVSMGRIDCGLEEETEETRTCKVDERRGRFQA